MSREKILVVDDEAGVRRSLEQILTYEGYRVCLAESGETALRVIEKEEPDLVLLDIKLPGVGGLDVLKKIGETHGDEVAVVMISGHGTISTAVDALKLGAFDFLEKPLDENRVLITIENALESVKLIKENRALRSDVERRYRIVGSSKVMQDVVKLAEKVAPSNVRVLIRGEHGTGKELIARYIHRMSKKAGGPFIELNCAAIPRELVESELFGHEKGAFTGAVTSRKGKFELADGGTLFLDEIGDMELAAQAKVLKAIETGKVTRLGGLREIDVDVRILAASNKNLADEIAKGTFREDLFYRLDVVQIYIPPLCERKEDIPDLVEAFLEDYAIENGTKKKSIEKNAIDYLKDLSWPGNVRELRNAIERLAILSSGDAISLDDVLTHIRSMTGIDKGHRQEFDTFQDFKEGAEKEFLNRKLEENGWNVSETARKLGMQRSNLYKKMEKYGLKRD
ncbi:MAG: sigma-54-dependent transcriptional regulator [Candidatus Glassbacteria bacterium]